MTGRSKKQTSSIDVSTPIFKGFIRGMLPLYLLMLLEKRSAHGTEMIRALAVMSGHRWSPSPGSVYPVLRRLEQEGLITGRWRRSQAAPQRVYRLSARGRKTLPKLREQLLNELHRARALLDEHIEALESGYDVDGDHHG